VTPIEMTSIASVLVTFAAVVILPIWFKRQSAKQAAIQARDLEAREKVQRELAEAREKARQDVKQAELDTVSWEKMNQALSTTVQAERADHRERIAELRELFAADTARLREQTDRELDRARKEIRDLSDRVQMLTQRLADLAAERGP
jgi:poly-D-alanine transfer protein DltD